jgi:alginate O-acetyltransferase complex protein AlgI
MLFNSYDFVFIFLPITAGIFYLCGRHSTTLAIRWLILASLFFYAWWRPLNVLLIAPSILVNFAIARLMLRFSAADRRGPVKALLIAGIAFNVCFLGYFKYANFFVGVMDDVSGANFVLANIILPLGISFITFQKIAFLVDVAARRVESFTLQDYCLFVLFFPQLIAGPIVHYREVMPQFQRIRCTYDPENVAVGLALFFCGLCKKAFLADGIAPMVTSIFGQATAGHPVSFVYGWMAALGFTLQIYFDFSGYSDMAIGIARLFGIRLPANFYSPLQASSIIDFWARWHMTLTRFLTAYIYNPMSLWLTRRRLARGLHGFGGRHTTVGSFISILMVPTIVTMCLCGLWHGAGYTFIFWGFLHGCFLVVNHLWRLIAHRRWHDKQRYARIMRPLGAVLTVFCAVTAMVFFRSPSMAAAWNILAGMAGQHGFTVPPTVFEHLGSLSDSARRLGVGLAPADARFFELLEWIAGLGALVFFCPNTLQILARYQPALGINSAAPYQSGPRLRLSWNISLGWGAVVAAVVAVGVAHLGGASEFLYWHF